MDPLFIILLLTLAGIVLLVGELLLPTHGLLGVAGVVCLGCAIGVVFHVNQWAGVIVLLAAIVASPFLLSLSIKLWQKSPVGRRIILQPVDSPRALSPVALGQVGIAVTELRPMGECEFGNLRLEAIAQLGIIPAGKPVRVVAIDNGRPTVRQIGKENS